ncbi:hypothetical protein [uncultured Helicobacter sp.]|uniref:hypothetical protein n=1 Tax=uncultured Helicobacter sp. TaxID=175537 RepID=UPI002618E30E|nr:hypothetical protein [uncultured Helicobacter sp.]
MSDKELEIFELCEKLVDLLGDKEAIADLQTLLDRHPEMFQNKKQVASLIKKVVNDPEIIINNPTPKSEKDYIAGKKLNEKKMGEVGIRKDENISKIFHANEKNVKKMGQLDKKEVVYKQSMVGTPTSYTQAQSLDERLVQKNISSTANEIIPQQDKSAKDFKSKLKEFNTKKAKTTLHNIGKNMQKLSKIYLKRVFITK